MSPARNWPGPAHGALLLSTQLLSHTHVPSPCSGDHPRGTGPLLGGTVSEDSPQGAATVSRRGRHKQPFFHLYTHVTIAGARVPNSNKRVCFKLWAEGPQRERPVHTLLLTIAEHGSPHSPDLLKPSVFPQCRCWK